MAGNLKSEAGSASAAETIKPQIFNCLNCGSTLEISALGSTNTIVCGKCSSIIDIGHPIYKILKKKDELQKIEPDIPLGTFGLLRGNKWKVIGVLVREDVTYKVQWREYLLFNPYEGFRFLFEMDGHYTVLRRLNWDPIGKSATGDQLIADTIELAPYGEFKVYNRGTAVVKHVFGEFYWRVRVGEKSELHDYICPPFLLSAEHSKTEINYTIGEYIPSEEIKAAFSHNPDFKFSSPMTISQNQPNPYGRHRGFNIKVWSIGVASLIVLFIGFSVVNSSSKIEYFRLTEVDINKEKKNYVSAPFEISGDTGNILLDLSSPLYNEWIEADISLVNEKTGEDYSLASGAEYYSGVDGGESWSEGSKNSSEFISQVPGGTYHLDLNVETDMRHPEINLKLTRNGAMLGNFLIILLMISFYPIWMLWRGRSFEMARWENSDYSPYFGGGTDSDGSIDLSDDEEEDY